MRAASTHETTTPLAELYDRDFHAWCLGIASLLGSGRTEELDLGHLREEIEGLALRDEREVVSRMKRIMQHLLKLRYQPEMRTRSWGTTILDQRGELALLLEPSPSLVAIGESNITKAYKLARRLASEETGLPLDVFPGECPYTFPQVLDSEFLPRA